MILITGHMGFIGSKLAKKLPYYVGIDKKDGKDLLTCDLPEDISLIYHLAAQSSVEDSWNNPLLDSYNYNMTVRLSQTYPNAKIIYANSCASLDIVSPYGLSKKVSGDYLKHFHKSYVSCIFPNIYGGHKSVVDIFQGKSEVTIYGDGNQVRDYVHVDDIVDGLLLAQNWPTGEYFMGSGIGTTVNELAQGKSIKHLPARKEIREIILPNTTPDWRPKIILKDYVK